MNRKGQALVEFIIILPIFIMLMLAAFDYVRIMQTKMYLENEMEEIVLDNSYKLEDDITLTTKNEEQYTKYILSKNIELSSPILSAVLKGNYNVEVTRSIYAK